MFLFDISKIENHNILIISNNREDAELLEKTIRTNLQQDIFVYYDKIENKNEDSDSENDENFILIINDSFKIENLNLKNFRHIFMSSKLDKKFMNKFFIDYINVLENDNTVENLKNLLRDLSHVVDENNYIKKNSFFVLPEKEYFNCDKNVRFKF